MMENITFNNNYRILPLSLKTILTCKLIIYQYFLKSIIDEIFLINIFKLFKVEDLTEFVGFV